EVEIHALLPRIGANIDDYTLGLVRQFELQGVRVINNSIAIERARDKFRTLQELARGGIRVVESCCVNNMQNLKRALDALGPYPVVLKLRSSRQGRGVTLADKEETARFIVENLRQPGRGIIVQRFYPNEERKDIRVLVVGDKVAGAALMTPAPGEFRSNVHVGGKGEAIDPGPELRGLALEASKLLGLEIAGVDILIPKEGPPMVVEVNYAPGFQGLEAVTGLDIARVIIKYITTSAGRPS
ncbi:MAG TPA: RimK family alpha-L-glutamate ligase, partial [Desulfobacterales bacterium]|nr:RimK family alpha-L-glutamate ligase [Desulfobacterales bacterium]